MSLVKQKRAKSQALLAKYNRINSSKSEDEAFLTLIKAALVLLDFPSVKKLQKMMNIKLEYSQLQARKLAAIEVEDYEDAIVCRDRQKELKSKIEDLGSTADLLKSTYSKLKKEQSEGSGGEDDTENFKTRPIQIKFQQVYQNRILKETEQISKENFNQTVDSIQKVVALLSTADHNIQKLEFSQLGSQAQQLDAIKIGSRAVTEYKTRLENIQKETRSFQKIVLKDRKFIKYSRAIFVYIQNIVSLCFNLISELDQDENNGPKGRSNSRKSNLVAQLKGVVETKISQNEAIKRQLGGLVNRDGEDGEGKERDQELRRNYTLLLDGDVILEDLGVKDSGERAGHSLRLVKHTFRQIEQVAQKESQNK